ncbi:uncharacterized protein [Anoplolepis gracilipes]|uniref:uncharacterized protein isoform X2 n=1 Tax=Anoplolepis gracilipes TaxID=354296 RepID=UPI003B9EC2AB
MRSTLFITTPLWHIAPALPAERPAWNTRSCLRCSACCCCRCRFCHRWRLLVIRDSDFGRERGIPEKRISGIMILTYRNDCTRCWIHYDKRAYFVTHSR